MYEISARISGLWDNYAHKLLCILKMTMVILLVSMSPLQASNVFGQRINYVQKQVSLEQLFKDIKKQTYYNVVWFDDNLNTKATLDVDFKNATIEEVMDRITSNQSASYQIKNKTIIIKWKAPSTGEKLKKTILNFFEALIDVTGRVVDERGDPLPGAKVRVNGSKQITTSTNANGEFRLKGIADNATITVSFIGYESKELPVSANMGAIKLAQSDAKLEEVEINAGYYTVKDKERTGSISRVTAETIGKQPVSNPLAALIGRMSGVNIEQQSGTNGGGFKVEIRGINSLRPEGRQPLYLIDGVPYPASSITNSTFGIVGLSGVGSPLNYLNPSDIESVEVLKDADATAIYGSRGANGVILVKTKSGKSGKTTIDLNFSTGLSKATSRIDLLNTEEYLIMRNEAFKNDGLVPGTTDYDINGTWDQNKYTDWQKKLIGGIARTTNAQLSIGGGSENTRFNFRSNYSKNGTVSIGDFNDQKGSGALAVNHTSVNKRFKADFSATYLVNRNNLPTTDLTRYIDLAPNAPDLYNSDGSLNWAFNSNGVSTWTNPLSNSINMPYIGKSNNFFTNGILNYELFKGLSLRSTFGYINIGLKENKLTLLSAQPPSSTAIGLNQISISNIETWIAEPQIRFQHDYFGGKFDLLLGATFQEDKQDNWVLVGTGYTSELLINSIGAAPTRNAASTGSMYKYNAIFGRINYNYHGKYIINLTGRRDGSSKFGPGKQFGNFGAAGLAWIFTEEGFVKKTVPFISFGKIRVSYGLTGSDQIPDYGYLETLAATRAYPDGSGLYPARLANPDYSWETNRKLEAAIELGFLNDKLMFSADWYRNRTSNQLVGYNLPDITGFTSVQYNLPATVQNTGFEFELNGRILNTNRLKWSSSINLTVPQNKLLDYPNIQGSAYANTYTVGASLYAPRVYHYLGVDPKTGAYSFTDLDGNGIINNFDRIPSAKALTSHFYAGLQNSFTYAGFTLDFSFQYVNKTARDPMLQFGLPGIFGLAPNRPNLVLQRWQEIDDQADIQKFTQSGSIDGLSTKYTLLGASDRFVDASFLRLKNVAVNWNVPSFLLAKTGVSAVKLYIQGQNLFTLTKYSGDPETTNVKSLPTLTTITAGVQISL